MRCWTNENTRDVSSHTTTRCINQNEHHFVGASFLVGAQLQRHCSHIHIIHWCYIIIVRAPYVIKLFASSHTYKSVHHRWLLAQDSGMREAAWHHRREGTGRDLGCLRRSSVSVTNINIRIGVPQKGGLWVRKEVRYPRVIPIKRRSKSPGEIGEFAQVDFHSRML